MIKSFLQALRGHKSQEPLKWLMRIWCIIFEYMRLEELKED